MCLINFRVKKINSDKGLQQNEIKWGHISFETTQLDVNINKPKLHDCENKSKTLFVIPKISTWDAYSSKYIAENDASQ